MNQRRNQTTVSRRRSTLGFTIIELSLAMGFVSVLLLAIALLTIQISHMYNKGITLRQVNEAGRIVSRDLTRTVGNSATFDTTVGGPNFKNVATGAGALGGKLCLGTVSYLWNYPASFEGANTPLNTYADAPSTQIHFVRVSDTGAKLCSATPPAIHVADTTSLLEAGDRDLYLWKFDVKSANEATDDRTALYQIDFTIGTSGKTGAIDSASLNCKPPSDADAYDDYCSVNDFSTIIQSGNTGEGSS